MRPDDEQEFRELAQIHEEVPRAWWPNHVVTDKAVEIWVKNFRANSKNKRSLYLVAEKDSGIIGFHWIELQGSLAHIKSLWVHEQFQGQGVAREMKRRGEEWAKSQQATEMRTSVHFNNRRMLDLNLKSGFEADFVPLSKKISGNDGLPERKKGLGISPEALRSFIRNTVRRFR